MTEAVYAVSGAVIGAVLMGLHEYTLHKAVREEHARREKEVRQLKEALEQATSERDAYERSADCADAYKRGRKDPMTQAERFASNFERAKTAKFVTTGAKK